jgi:DNA polymerase-3 subunit gamma/tau
MATQSLYRRYRPQRFADLKGQDHVVRALRTAVAEGREGQAYLFSGPRGTGKTSTARILAKVLNCENPVDGEPCCECDSCLAVERGTSYDVHELDAASNRGVEDMRQLVAKASLGTPGRHKVYILDEVHMLTDPASATLLKTLEEPPDHVVFVLATTDPQKVIPTIRSRTQHLQFHLLPTDTLREHVQWVVDDAGLVVSDEAIGQVLTEGGGSARDTLSALELSAAGGGEAGELVLLDEIIDAMIDSDPGRALEVVARAVSAGRAPRMITEEIVALLRNRFLALMAPELVQLPSEQIEAVAEQARQVGAPGLVRGIEQLGTILIEMRDAPDPRVLLDVAVVQLTSDAVGTDTTALAARLQKLERRVAEIVAAPPAGSGTEPKPATSGTPRDSSTGRAALGGRARRSRESSTENQSTVPGPENAEPAAAEREPEGATEPVRQDDAATGQPGLELAAPVAEALLPEVTKELWESLRPTLRGRARAMYSSAQFIAGSDAGVTLGFPNQAHLGKCEQYRSEVEARLAEQLGSPVTMELVIFDGPGAVPSADADDSAPAPSHNPSAITEPVRELPEDHDVDLDGLVDAPPESVKTPIDRLAEAFPGSELVEDTP